MASLLYYRKFHDSLKSIGFEFNPYDPCVANKIINGNQMTIRFHVDDKGIRADGEHLVEDEKG